MADPNAVTARQRIYEFLIEPIRQADKDRGFLFLQRALDGPQQVWETTQQNIFCLPTIWDFLGAPDDALPFLKDIVGWTAELANITDGLSSEDLRRLIGVSGRLWKERGPEQSILDIVQLFTGARVRIWNWFDFRFVIDETEMGQENEGRDPWLIGGTPGAPLGELTLNVRVVDRGGLNRTLLTNVLEQARPNNETFEVAFIQFLDLFDTDGDSTQWTAVGASSIAVANSLLVLSDDSIAESAFVSVPEAAAFSEYVCFWRLRSELAPSRFGMQFYRVDDSNFYSIEIDVATSTIFLDKTVAGAPTNLDSTVPTAPLVEDTFYGVRVAVVDVGGGVNDIQVYLDNVLVLSATDSAFSGGTVGVFHESGSRVELDEVELFELPLEVQIIGPDL